MFNAIIMPIAQVLGYIFDLLFEALSFLHIGNVAIAIILFTIMTIIPIGRFVGLTKMPLSYFVFLLLVVLLYISLVSIAKSWYVKKYKELI